MAVGKSGRIVLEIDPATKQEMYERLKQRGLTLKEWFLLQVASDLDIDPESSTESSLDE